MADLALEHAQEQEDELEALESIYDDCFSKDSEDGEAVSVSVLLEPEPDGTEAENHVALRLRCAWPAEYPEVAPEVSVEVLRGIAKEQVGQVVALVEEAIEENLGSPMVYTLAEAVREWLVEHNVPGEDGSAYASMMRKQREKELEAKRDKERQERREIGLADAAAASARFKEADEHEGGDEAWRQKRLAEGTPVTPDSFAVWLTALDKETGYAEARASEDDGRPTGKQIFLQAQETGSTTDMLAAEEAAEAAAGDGGDGDDIAESKIDIDADLFDSDSDLDLDDLDDEDDEDDEGADGKA